MAFRSLFIESQCALNYKGGYLIARTTEGATKVYLSEIQSIILQNPQANISAYLLSELAKNKISLVISDEKCNPIGQYLPLYGAHNTSKRVVEQLAWGEPVKKRVWQRVVQEKIRQQVKLLEELEHTEAAKTLRAIQDEVKSGDTTNREAHAARVYFAALFSPSFSRDSAHTANAFLNYGYAILLSMVNREIISHGYLTQYGICHRNEYNQFNFSCDLMEPFRPMVDRIAYPLTQGEFGKEARRCLGNLGNCEVGYKDGTYKLHSVVALFVQDCLSALNKCTPIDEIAGYEPT